MDFQVEYNFIINTFFTFKTIQLGLPFSAGPFGVEGKVDLLT